MLAADLAPHLVRYRGKADPAYYDGDGAESFGTLLRRQGRVGTCRPTLAQSGLRL